MRLALLPLALLLAHLPAAAAPKAEDARCLALAMLSTQNADAKIRESANLALSYWLGRMDSTGTPAQVRAMLVSQAAALDDANLPRERTRCSAATAPRLTSLADTAKAMQAARTAKRAP